MDTKKRNQQMEGQYKQFHMVLQRHGTRKRPNLQVAIINYTPFFINVANSCVGTNIEY